MRAAIMAVHGRSPVADFVTAMMAFGLLMWLLGSTAKGNLQGIAEYFQTPLKVAMSGGDGSGDSSSVIKGGGKDLSLREGRLVKGDIDARRKPITCRPPKLHRQRSKPTTQGLKEN